MDTVAAAPKLLASLFPDGGRQFLRDADLGATWGEALASVPPQLLKVPEPAAGLRQLSRLRDFWAGQDDLQPALAASRALLHIRVQVVGAEHPDAYMEIGALGALVQRAGRVEEGGQLLEKAYAGLRDHGVSDMRLAIVAGNVGIHRVRMGELTGGAEALRRALELRQRLAPRTVDQVAAQLAEVLLMQDRVEEAVKLLEQAWRVSKSERGADHPRTVARARSYGLALARDQQWERAATVLGPIHDARSRQPMDDEGAALAFALGIALSRSGQLEAGTRAVEACLRWTREQERALGQPHDELPDRLSEWANLQLHRNRSQEAEGLILEAMDVERRLWGDDSIEVARRYLELARFYIKMGRKDEALGWVDPAASLHRSILGDQHKDTKVAVEAQLSLLLEQAKAASDHRDPMLAWQLLDAGLAQAGPVLGYNHATVRRARELHDRLQPKA